MPKLSELNKIVTRKLPVSGAEVELQDSLTWEQSQELETITEDGKRGERTLEMILKGWNVTDDAGQPLELVLANVYKLPTSDVKELYRYIMTELVRARTEEERKNEKALRDLADEHLKQLDAAESSTDKAETLPTAEAITEPEPEAENPTDTDTNVATTEEDETPVG